MEGCTGIGNSGMMHLKLCEVRGMPRIRAGMLGNTVAGLTFALVIATGCHTKSSATPANFIKGLNAHFIDHPECLFTEAPRFPLETSDPVRIKQMNALADAQLLKASAGVQVSRFVTTPAGARLAPRFCYGHRVVTAIDSFTPPAPRNGFPETNVVYRYRVEDVPVWAQSQGVRAAFPGMARQTAGENTDKATLAGTMAGWQVPD
jgi:hypothetical protein